MAAVVLEYNADRAEVRIVVDGSQWFTEELVTNLSVIRSAPGEAAIPVRGTENLAAIGGSWIGIDHELPLGTTVTYRVAALNEWGIEVDAFIASIESVATDCDLFIKAPGRPDLTQRPVFAGVGDSSSPIQGGVYDVHSGPAISHWSGVRTESVDITVRTQDRGEAMAMEGLLREARVVLIQHGGDPEVAPGWYEVSDVRRSNPAQRTYQRFGKRAFTLSLRAVGIPAGVGVLPTGVTWSSVVAEFASWSDVMASRSTWLDVQRGA